MMRLTLLLTCVLLAASCGTAGPGVIEGVTADPIAPFACAGEQLTVTGITGVPSATLELWVTPDADLSKGGRHFRPAEVRGVKVGVVETSPEGRFSASFVVPRLLDGRGEVLGSQELWLADPLGGAIRSDVAHWRCGD